MNHESWPTLIIMSKKDTKRKYLLYLFTGRVTCIQVPVQKTRQSRKKKRRRDGDNDKVCLIYQPDCSEMMSVCFFFSIFCHTDPNFRLFSRVVWYTGADKCWYRQSVDEVLDSVVWFDQCQSDLSLP